MAGKGQVKCLRCKGQGFVGDAELPSIEAPPASNGEVEFPDETQPAITADVDPNGSPRYLPDGQENPNFGKWPQFKDPTLP
jgi:hypothetical protein